MTPSDDLQRLVERIEGASEGSRELDREIKQVYGHDWDYSAQWDRWDAVNQRKVSDPVAKPYTFSIDTAMTLAPEGWTTSVTQYPDGRGSVEAWHPSRVHMIETATKSPALAVSAFALRARIAQEKSNGHA